MTDRKASDSAVTGGENVAASSPKKHSSASSTQHERLDPSTRGSTNADNHARRWTSFLGGGGDGGGSGG